MIKVLHVYPKNDSLTARFIHLLMDKIESKATDNADEFKRLCREWQPDIIHQHGSVDVKWQADARWVVSPNGLRSTFDDYYAVVARSPLEAETLRALGAKRIEVYDNSSDVFVYDTETHTILKDTLTMKLLWAENTPVFSPDGRWLYYTTANKYIPPTTTRNAMTSAVWRLTKRQVR